MRLRRKKAVSAPVPAGFGVAPPAPGWGRRWLSEGAASLRNAPSAIVIYLAMMPIPGLAFALMKSADVPSVALLPASLAISMAVCPLAVALMCREMDRAEGIASTLDAGALRSIFAMCLRPMITVTLLAATISGVEMLAPEAERGSASAWAVAAKVCGLPAFFALFFMKIGHALPALAARGVGGPDAKAVAAASDAEIRKSARFPQVKMTAFWAAAGAVPPLALLAGPFFIAAARASFLETVSLPGDGRVAQGDPQKN